MINGVKSDLLPVSLGILQGSVLGPFSVPTGSLYMYADDTTIFCVKETADLVIVQLNKALQEFYNWRLSRSYRPFVGTKFSVKFGCQDETVWSDSEPKTNVLERKKSFSKKVDLLISFFTFSSSC